LSLNPGNKILTTATGQTGGLLVDSVENRSVQEARRNKSSVSDEHPEKLQTPSLPSPSIVEMSTMIYGVMGAIGLAATYWGQGNLQKLFSIPKSPELQLKFAAIALLGIGVLLALSYFFEHWFIGYRMLRRSMLTILGDVSLPAAFYIALLSSVGEELLFRGAIQPSVGLVVASGLFGAMHLGPGGRISSWSVWAFLAGLLLGAIAESTQSLLPAIAIHFGINSASIIWLRRDWKKLTEDERKLFKNVSTDLEVQEP
jgi:membrane protease YdiL (CAAX protease family)